MSTSTTRPEPSAGPGPKSKFPMRLGALALAALVVAGLVMGVPAVYHFFWGADYHYRAAQKALDLHDYDAAQAHTLACLKARPTSLDVQLLAARVQRRANLPVLPDVAEVRGRILDAPAGGFVGSFEEAERHVREYERLGGAKEFALLERLLAMAQQGKLDAPAEGGAGGRSIATVLRSLVKDNPEGPMILEALSNGYLRSYRLIEAEGTLGEWLALKKDDVQARLWRGWVREREGNLDGAEEDYAAVVNRDPDHQGARLQLAQILHANKKTPEATAEFEELRRRQPPGGEGRDVLVGLGRCWRESGRLRDAKELFDQALERSPNDVIVLTELAGVEQALNRLDDARGHLERALNEDPGDYPACNGLYNVLQRLGRKDEAKQLLPRVEKLEKTYKDLETATRKIATAPHDPAPRFEAGRLLLDLGKKEAALRWFDTALKEDPRHVPTHRALADYYEKEGKAELAERHRRLAREAAEPRTSRRANDRTPAGRGG